MLHVPLCFSSGYHLVTYGNGCPPLSSFLAGSFCIAFTVQTSTLWQVRGLALDIKVLEADCCLVQGWKLLHLDAVSASKFRSLLVFILQDKGCYTGSFCMSHVSANLGQEGVKP